MKLFQHDHEADYAGKRWVYTGLAFGLVMYVFALLLAFFSSDGNFTLKTALLLIPIWVLGGLAYGAMMKLFFRSRSRRVE